LIIAYEPDQKNFRKLSEFVHENCWNNVRLINEAVGATPGTKKLYKGLSSSRLTFTGRDPRTGENLTAFVPVTTVTLSDALADLQRVDLLKTDCEGAEYEILLNSDKNTLSKITRMVIEYHGNKGDVLVSKLSQKLKRNCFDIIMTHKTGEALGMIYAHHRKK